jgi:hypothetical protein
MVCSILLVIELQEISRIFRSVQVVIHTQIHKVSTLRIYNVNCTQIFYFVFWVVEPFSLLDVYKVSERPAATMQHHFCLKRLKESIKLHGITIRTASNSKLTLP